MELSKNTWHARNYNAWLLNSRTRRARATRYGDRPVELCSYVRIALFWGFFRRFGERIFASLFALVFTAMVLAWAWLVGDSVYNFGAWWLNLLAGAGTVLVGAAILFGMVASVVTAIEWYKDRPYKEGPSHEPNVVVEAIKAKKRRICPIIELKD